MMTTKNIDELNSLLVDHSECLTDFYNEVISYGIRKGICGGIFISGIGVTILYAIIKIKSRFSKKKES